MGCRRKYCGKRMVISSKYAASLKPKLIVTAKKIATQTNSTVLLANVSFLSIKRLISIGLAPSY
jgi:hypothetical protein